MVYTTTYCECKKAYYTVDHRVETYTLTMINVMFCLDMCVIYRCETLSVLMFERSEIMGTYNTPDIIAKMSIY